MPGSPAPALRWWAQRWLALVEDQGPEFAGRLKRARSYARNGHVWQLSVQPGKISAQVLGSYGYYTSTVHIPVAQAGVWERAVEPLADRPALLAALLADDLPVETERLFSAAGIALFPAHPGELSYHCTCPDWERPCKHALAVCYEFAARCDAHPSLLLTLAGRTVDQLMAEVRARWNATESGQTGAPDDSRRPMRVDGFYTAGRALDSFHITYEPPQVNAGLLFQLGKPPFSGEREDPLGPLAAFYEVMSGMAWRTLQRARQLGTHSQPASRSGEDSEDSERVDSP